MEKAGFQHPQPIQSQTGGALRNPHVPSAKLHGAKNIYKIKLRSVGYRLVYEVLEREIVVLVIAVGRRDKADFYSTAIKRSQ